MSNQKVVWKDGMFILPHHFQQMERYLLNITQQTSIQSIPYHYGFSSFRINSTILADGVFQLDNAAGILPDGTPFSFQTAEELPIPRKAADQITDPTKPILVYLAVPTYWPGRAAYTDTASLSDGRFVRGYSPFTDEDTGTSSESIEVARLNAVTLFEGENLEGYSVMPIAKIRKLVSGVVEVVDSFVPPLLRISGSVWLLDTVRSIASALRIRGTELMRARRETGSNLAEFPPEELTALTFLHSISTYLPQLEMYIGSARQITPFTMSTLLGQLAGSLSVFRPGSEMLSLPAYSHDDVAPFYSSCRELINTLLSGEYAPNNSVIDLRRTGPVTFDCPLDDSVDLAGSELYIGIRANMNPADLNRAVEGLMKVSSNTLMPRLMVSAMPGLKITSVLNPAQRLAAKDGYLYYELSKSGEHWDSIVSTVSLSVYFPGNLDNLSIQLLVTKGDS